MSKGRGLKRIKRVGPRTMPKGTFAALEGALAKRPGVKSPGGLAASIGRAKFGAKCIAKMAAKGRRRKK